MQDECPLLLVSNYHVTFLLQRHEDVTNKRLKVAQWTWDDTAVPPLAAFLYVLKLASDLWRQGAKRHLCRDRVPVTPTQGYRLGPEGRSIALNAAWPKGYTQLPLRQQPERSSKRSHPGDSGEASGEAADAARGSPTSGSPTSSSTSSSCSTEAVGWFDAAAWEPSCMGLSAAAAVEALPMLPAHHVTCGPVCLASGASRRIFKVSAQLGRWLLPWSTLVVGCSKLLHRVLGNSVVTFNGSVAAAAGNEWGSTHTSPPWHSMAWHGIAGLLSCSDPAPRGHHLLPQLAYTHTCTVRV